MSRRIFIIEDEAVAREIEAMLERKRINIERRRTNPYRRPNPIGYSNPYENYGGSCGNTLGSCSGSRLYENVSSCSVGSSCGSFNPRRRNILNSCGVGPSC